MAADVKEMTLDRLEQAAGGNIPDGPGYMTGCSHEHRERTGRVREDYRYIIFSEHQVEYYCHDCGKTVWIDEDE